MKIAIIAAVYLGLYLAIYSRLRRAEIELKQGEIGRYRLEREKAIEGERVRDVMRRVRIELNRQRATCCGPRVSCCLNRAGEPVRIVSRAVALEALKRTRRELEGRRFNLDALDRAIDEINAIPEPGDGRK